MLKKAGIVLAAVVAALLSVSPLAFAHDSDRTHGDGKHTVQSGLVNVSDTTLQVPVQACGNDVGVLSGAFGLLLGSASNTEDKDVDCDQNNSSD
ncbi:MAG: hypothetical protein J2P20_03800 [Pseudonocardia sp.]|nr:hypothetical protein [Pseudonocardia sp.]MBO0873285.1 hypothetical protein [Pseudonocardia sp.]